MRTPVDRGREDSGSFLAYTRADAAFQEDYLKPSTCQAWRAFRWRFLILIAADSSARKETDVIHAQRRSFGSDGYAFHQPGDRVLDLR